MYIIYTTHYNITDEGVLSSIDYNKGDYICAILFVVGRLLEILLMLTASFLPKVKLWLFKVCTANKACPYM